MTFSSPTSTPPPMTDSSKSDYALGTLLVLIAARGGHWLITPMRHPDATLIDHLFVWGQIIICLAAGLRLIRRSKTPASAP